MSSFKRIEKIFSLVGTICTIVGITVLMLVAGHFILGIIAFLKPNKPFTPKIPDGHPVYENFSYTKAYWEEHEASNNVLFEPHFHWRRTEFRGDYINVSSQGIRRTVAQDFTEDPKEVFMFGGSTLWGTGSRDEHTISSYLQLQLGKEFRVTNYGEKGFVSTQELNLLLLLLAQGEVPDVVIFYDGVNDGYTGVYSPSVPRDPHSLRMDDKQEREITNLQRLFSLTNYSKLSYLFMGGGSLANWDSSIKPHIDENVSATINFYESHIRQVKALGKEYGFESYFFWQPNLFSKTRETYDYEESIIKNASLVYVESQRQVYLKAKAQFSNRGTENILFFGDIFNQTEEPIYIDWCHIGPVGNEIIAERMYQEIKDRIRTGKQQSLFKPDLK